jgi:hypothetical protein
VRLTDEIGSVCASPTEATVTRTPDSTSDVGRADGYRRHVRSHGDPVTDAPIGVDELIEDDERLVAPGTGVPVRVDAVQHLVQALREWPRRADDR